MSPFAHLIDSRVDLSLSNQDDVFFLAALRLARSAMGLTHPNPNVGAVIVKNGQLIATGHTQSYGGMHGEVHALANAKADVAGATLYVTLEPCSHFGRTPPCTDAIINAGIKRVVYGTVDPHPLVFGQGVQKLSNAAVEVSSSLHPELARMAKAHIAPFMTQIFKKRPYVVVKIASSKDGKIALKRGIRTKITGQAADRVVHRLRESIDAVMVGANTARMDNPKLFVRLVDQPRRQPARVVLSSDLNLSDGLDIFDTKVTSTLVMTNENLSTSTEPFTKLGVKLIGCKMHENAIDIEDALAKLSSLGFQSVLVEPGAVLFKSLMEHSFLVDEIWWFSSLCVLGRDGLDLGYTDTDLCQLGFFKHETHMIGEDELTIFKLSDSHR